MAMMGRTQHIFSLGRCLVTLRDRASKSYVKKVAYYFHHISSNQRTVKTIRMPAPSVVPTQPIDAVGQCRHRNTFGGRDDDDEGQDAREQKSAFLRALEGSKGNKNNGVSSRNRISNEQAPKRGKWESKNTNPPKNPLIPIRRNNQRNPTAKASRTSKKLTLDEFFASLEKTQTNGDLSSKPAMRRSRERMTSKTRKPEKERLQPQCENNNDRSKITDRAAPIADMESFFEEVNARMERKKKDESSSKSTRKLPTTGTYSTHSSPSFRTSILDIIPPSPRPGKLSKNASRRKEKPSLCYNCSVESWDQYCELLDEVMEGPKFLSRFHSKKKKIVDEVEAETNHQIMQIVEWLSSDAPLVETHLSTLDLVLKGDVRDRHEEQGADGIFNQDDETTLKGVYSRRRELFREELNGQKERFVNESGWTNKQYDVAVGALVAIGSLCAKKCMAPPLDVAWSKLKELGYPMNKKDVLHNYLYVSSTFSLPKRNSFFTNTSAGNRGTISDASLNDDHRGDGESSLSLFDFLDGSKDLSSSLGDSNEVQDELDVSAEVALCHDFLHNATEQSTGIHVRRLVRLGKANEAERLIDATTKNDDVRLRTYAPIYQTYLDQGDVSSAFKLFVKMKENENVILLTETYVQLIACIAENGYFRNESKEIHGVENLPYETKCGPKLLDILMSELAEHSIEITSASAKRLYNAFQRGFRVDDPKKNLKQLHLLESLRTNNDLAEPDEMIVSRVQLDQSTGRCPRSAAQLRLINLDPKQKKRFQEALLYLVASSYQERHGNAKTTDVGEKLDRFGKWLQSRDGKPFTAIIDGPNIAYYMQNFQDGTFNFYQIKFVVDALEKMGENVLVVLPKKYTYDRFSIQKPTSAVKQTLSSKEKEIRDDLIAKGKAYVVPIGSLDDYYWMYASVTMNEEFVPPDNPEGRWPGNRPMLISNDKLRDHKMSLLEPRLFRRWYSNFLVNFTFSAFVNDECIDKEIGFKPADFYSREIQGNNSNGNGTTWHVPVSDWAEHESLCIRIPHSVG